MNSNSDMASFWRHCMFQQIPLELRLVAMRQIFSEGWTKLDCVVTLTPLKKDSLVLEPWRLLAW